MLPKTKEKDKDMLVMEIILPDPIQSKIFWHLSL